MIAVLGGLADVERDLISTRTAKGARRGAGAKMGRPSNFTPHQKEAIKRREQGEETLAEIGRSYTVIPARVSGSRRGWISS
jgi:DNA invertase Pin-like site-specific DNA recombinase